MKKKNGFSGSFDIYQIWSLLIFTINVTFGVLVYYNLVPDSFKIEICSVYLIITTLTFILGFQCMKSDPSDRNITNNQTKTRKQQSEIEYILFCSICKSSVKEKTKHCQKCNRCVENFDHHCRWLNNCIGNLNYRLFVSLIVSVLLFLAYNTGLGTFFLVDYYTNNDYSVIKSYTQDNYYVIVVLLYIYIILNSVLTLLDLNLILFHIWLRFQNLTTYEYLKKNQLIKNKPKKIEEQTKSVQLLQISKTPEIFQDEVGQQKQIENLAQNTLLSRDTIKEQQVEQNDVVFNLEKISSLVQDQQTLPIITHKNSIQYQIRILPEIPASNSPFELDIYEEDDEASEKQQKIDNDINICDTFIQQQNIHLIQKIPLKQISENSYESISIDSNSQEEQYDCIQNKNMSFININNPLTHYQGNQQPHLIQTHQQLEYQIQQIQEGQTSQILSNVKKQESHSTEIENHLLQIASSNTENQQDFMSQNKQLQWAPLDQFKKMESIVFEPDIDLD